MIKKRRFGLLENRITEISVDRFFLGGLLSTSKSEQQM